MIRSATLLAALVISAAAFAAEITSGHRVGDTVPSYDPKHVAGPDRGKMTCPVC